MTPKLPPEIKTRWLDALRSGKYRQTTGQLYRTEVERSSKGKVTAPTGYCCLGVLCRTLPQYGKFDNEQHFVVFKKALDPMVQLERSDASFPPEALSKVLGLTNGKKDYFRELRISRSDLSPALQDKISAFLAEQKSDHDLANLYNLGIGELNDDWMLPFTLLADIFEEIL